MPEIRTLTATRYIQPLREGGSLPAVVDTHGGGMFVVKFRGAGQGEKALIAELIVGLIATELGLPVPEMALIEIPPPLGLSEPDPEIQDILRKSHGLNFGMRYLDGAFNYSEVAAGELISAELAAATVWLDAFTTNPDRTHRNANLLIHERKPWLIDHGAALYAHHDWPRVDDTRTRSPFPLIREHILLARAEGLVEADEHAAAALGDGTIAAILERIPDEWLVGVPGSDFTSAQEARDRYQRYLTTRLAEPRDFMTEAEEARGRLLREPPRHLQSRR